jgi:hypothetical protein
MKSRFAGAFCACAVFVAAAAARAGQPGPMERVASDLGTPKIGYTARDDSHTHSMIEFVRSDETVNNWTKLFTVVAARVDVDRMQAETRATIARIRALLARDHAKVTAFDVRDNAPPVAYFNYTLGAEIDVGVIFSPIPGVVTTQEVAAHHPGVITAKDIRRIKALVNYPG